MGVSNGRGPLGKEGGADVNEGQGILRRGECKPRK